MSPLEFFGLAPLTGKLNIAPVGATLEVKPTDYRGPGRLSVSGTYPPVQFSARFLGHEFALAGNMATFQFSVRNPDELDLFVAYVDALFPALFSGALHAPIEIEDISGTLKGFQLTVRSSLSSSNGPLCTSATLPLKEYFEGVAPQDFLPAVFLISSLRYLQQADRLQAEGRHLTTFLAERILNIAKALEAIFPGDVNGMRAELKALGVNGTYADVFSTVRYLRNQVDVGHVSFCDLPQGSVQEILDFSDLATSCVRALVNSLMRNREEQERLLQLRKGVSSGKVPNAIEYIKKYRDVPPPIDNNLAVIKKNLR